MDDNICKNCGAPRKYFVCEYCGTNVLPITPFSGMPHVGDEITISDLAISGSMNHVTIVYSSNAPKKMNKKISGSMVKTTIEVSDDIRLVVSGSMNHVSIAKNVTVAKVETRGSMNHINYMR